MSVPTHLIDGTGGKTRARITDDEALQVSVVPPSNAAALTPEQLTRQKYYSAFLVDSADSPDMNIDGSTIPVEFKTKPVAGQAIHIRELRFEFESGKMNLNNVEVRRFGDAGGAAGITNGLDAFTEQGGEVQELFIEPTKRMSDFFRYVDGHTNIVDGVAVGIDLLIWIWTFAEDVTLPEGTLDEIVVRVNDDLTALQKFRVIASGWRELAE